MTEFKFKIGPRREFSSREAFGSATNNPRTSPEARPTIIWASAFHQRTSGVHSSEGPDEGGHFSGGAAPPARGTQSIVCVASGRGTT